MCPSVPAAAVSVEPNKYQQTPAPQPQQSAAAARVSQAVGGRSLSIFQQAAAAAATRSSVGSPAGPGTAVGATRRTKRRQVGPVKRRPEPVAIEPFVGGDRQTFRAN